MKTFTFLIQKAKTSAFYLRLLNFLLGRVVPFNKPHAFKIISVADDGGITIKLPCRKSNMNYIGGIHACALATLCEYVSGLSFMLNISPDDYRIILKNINMTYHYQAKTEVTASFNVSKEWIEKEIIEPLKNTDKIFKEVAVEVYDIHKNHICTGLINWQIKAWSKVNLKVD